jgi:Glucose / Sorbosone dehydrogenase
MRCARFDAAEIAQAASLAVALTLVGCGPAPIDPNRQVGANPYLPPIHQYLLPPMHVAKVVGWNGATPSVPAGLKVQAFATGLAIDHHWTKSLTASPDGSELYAGVGSNSNITENGIQAEVGRASIWQIDRATGAHREYATGLRNPNGLQFEPQTHTLWAVINERDELGPDLVPDYLTSVRDGAFYGWPYSYYGQHLARLGGFALRLQRAPWFYSTVRTILPTESPRSTEFSA